MAKGIFTQGVAVLLREAVDLAALRVALADFDIASEVAAADDWELSGPTLVVAYRPEVNGYLAVDIVDQCWPDGMGDAQNEPQLFGAWSMGYFGPYTYPGGLHRAMRHGRDDDLADAVAEHGAFIRLRASYVFGADDDAPVLPEACDPVDELLFATAVAEELLTLPQAIACFNPNGEVLMDQAHLKKSLDYHEGQDLPPFDCWCNIRIHMVTPDWHMMDTVGNWQLDMADHEVAFPAGKFQPSDVAHFLRNISLYVLKNGPIIKDGETADGPGNIKWQARTYETPLTDPPRQVLRWLPENQRNVPPDLKA